MTANQKIKALQKLKAMAFDLQQRAAEAEYSQDECALLHLRIVQRLYQVAQQRPGE